jgi:hemerythrin-like metal-binding protein
MAYMKWQPAYEVGFEAIDAQHHSLVEALNRLYAAMGEGRDRAEIERVLLFLRDYTVTHFEMEEALMIRYGYPGASTHFAAHADLVVQLSDLLADFRSGEAVLTEVVMAFLETWLVEHILGNDQRLGLYLRNRGAGA